MLFVLRAVCSTIVQDKLLTVAKYTAGTSGGRIF